MSQGIIMQQFNIAERPLRQEVEPVPSFMERFFNWNGQRPVQLPSNDDVFDNRDLDQRVRESGEW
jgi:hypothetical protein